MMTNPQTLAALEVRAAHRLACLDAILEAKLNVTTVGGILSWLDQVIDGRSVAEVVTMARQHVSQHLAWPPPAEA